MIKTRRPSADLEPLRVVTDALRLLSAKAFPLPTPLLGPDDVDGHVVTTQTLLGGAVPSGHDPISGGLLARGLAQHIELLIHRPDLISRAGLGPSWCRYQTGLRPVPHDTLVDFKRSTLGYEWLDHFGRHASE